MRDTQISLVNQWWSPAGQALWSTPIPGVGKGVRLDPDSPPWKELPGPLFSMALTPLTGRLFHKAKFEGIVECKQAWGDAQFFIASFLLLQLRSCRFIYTYTQMLSEARSMFWSVPSASNQTQVFLLDMSQDSFLYFLTHMPPFSNWRWLPWNLWNNRLGTSGGLGG